MLRPLWVNARIINLLNFHLMPYHSTQINSKHIDVLIDCNSAPRITSYYLVLHLKDVILVRRLALCLFPRQYFVISTRPLEVYEPEHELAINQLYDLISELKLFSLVP